MAHKLDSMLVTHLEDVARTQIKSRQHAGHERGHLRAHASGGAVRVRGRARDERFYIDPCTVDVCRMYQD